MLFRSTPRSAGIALAGRLLVAPVKQQGRLSTLELIDESGSKAALAGRGTKAGGYWATERLPEGDGSDLLLLVGEGVATCLSATAATGRPSVAALSSGNLPTVARAMRERYPAGVLTILADLVKATGQPDPHAVEAALAVNGRLAVPDFGADRDPGMTDFNDLAVLAGDDAVRLAIVGAAAPAKVDHPAPAFPAAEDAEQSGWPTPHPLTAKSDPEPYPLDALPPTVRAAVEEVVDRKSVV